MRTASVYIGEQVDAVLLKAYDNHHHHYYYKNLLLKSFGLC